MTWSVVTAPLERTYNVVTPQFWSSYSLGSIKGPSLARRNYAHPTQPRVPLADSTTESFRTRYACGPAVLAVVWLGRAHGGGCAPPIDLMYFVSYI